VITRRDGEEFLALAPQIPIQTTTESFPLREANAALERLRTGQLIGAVVLVPERKKPPSSNLQETQIISTSLHPAWLNAIHDPAMYPHPVSRIQLVETHISWVILTGDWAYKLKKPVNFGFVDFTTLELRHAACHEEVRLNRRTAPELYDDVVPLAADPDGPRFGGTGPVLEYAVRMRQFAQESLLDQCLARKELSFDVIDTLAHEVANLHCQAAVASIEAPYGEPNLIRETVQACLDVLAKTSLPNALRSQLKQLNEWIDFEWHRLKETFVERQQQGWVRECHGDLHLGNLVLYHGRPMLFDCLEFNPQLRWIDVLSDVAFLVMDLHDRGATPLAWRVLNEWLEQTGDYRGLQVLNYYLAYRALVRAKVAAIRLQQPELPLAEEQHQHHLLDSYVELATRLTRPSQAAIILMHGVSGSGKSFVARQLASSLEAVQIRSDVERKRSFGVWSSRAQTLPPETEMYSVQATRETYLRLQSLARTIVHAGYPVIVDAAFLRRSDRQTFAALASELAVPFVIVACRAPDGVLRERVSQRQSVGRDASDADVNVLERQLATAEPLDPSETSAAVVLNTACDGLPSVVCAIQNLIRHGVSK